MDPTQPSPTAPFPAQGPGPSQVLHVVARPGGLQTAIGLAVFALLLGAVFAIGLGLGAVTMFAGSMAETPIVSELYRDGGRSTVAVIPVEGVIDSYRAEAVRGFVDDVLRTRSIKAVVLRVDSPGGGIAPSDQIWYQVKRLRDEGLPVVASYGGLAASGGYYVSCAADHIVAEPTCITGSIGVIAQTFIFKTLLDKIGVEPVTMLATDSPEKDIGNPFREWTDDDLQQYTAMLDAAYVIFNQRVKDGRKSVITDPAKIDEIADGSIFTAAEALDNGLVDEIGYLDDAIVAAESQAGLRQGSSTVIILRQQIGLFGDLLGASGPDLAPRLGNVDHLRSLVTDMTSPRVMYLMR